ncbi:sensor histidine kinase [Streptomyces poriticola]|uniref:sensor histidine kinase n=1 Tax=Streptomyces poriticola TaxID=3120506 RepID=UPI002FCE48C3
MRRTLTRESVPRLAVIAIAAAEIWATRSLGSPSALAAGCLAVAALTVRGRWPVCALLATLPALSLGYVWLAPMAALYSVALVSGAAATVCCAGAVAVVSFVPWPHLGPVSLGPSAVALALMFSSLVSGTPVVLARLVASQRELRARMAELAVARAREEQLVSGQTILRERVRLSRDIHDTVAHHLSLITLQTGALEVAVPPERRQDAARVRRSSQAALADLRRLVALLRAPTTDGTEEVSPPGFADLPALITAGGPLVTGDLECLPSLDCAPELQEAVFRVVQESLTNARKHALGGLVTVLARRTPASLEVQVRNRRGRGRPASHGQGDRGGSGIQGMRERTASLGGTLRAHRLPDGGFSVRASFPLPASAVTERGPAAAGTL